MISLINKNIFPKVVGDAPEIATPFLEHKVDFTKLEKAAAKYRFVNKVIIIGNGANVTTLRGVYQALFDGNTPKKILIDSNEPDYLKFARDTADKSKTLVLASSRSGETASQIEAFLYFLDFPHKLVLTGKTGALREISERENIELVDLPDNISGRFASFTEMGMLPALIFGFDARGIASGLANRKEIELSAWDLACGLWELEQQGIIDVLIPTHSIRLYRFGQLVQQLMHESLGKKGLGFTVLPVTSPESQHHTNQRVFDGRKNMAVIYVKTVSEDLTLSVPANLRDIKLRGRTLADFDLVNLSKSFEAEYLGTQKILDNLAVPNITIEVGKVSPQTVGEYIFFWQMMAVYGAAVRGLSPYDQPAVEASKDISFKSRFS